MFNTTLLNQILEKELESFPKVSGGEIMLFPGKPIKP